MIEIEDELSLRIISCPLNHKIIVANSFPFEHKGIKCQKCEKEYDITPSGRIRYENGKAVSKEITGE